MQVTYDLKVDEINQNFIDSIKTLFANKEVRVTIEDMNVLKEKEINELDIEPISEDDPDYQYILEAKKENNKSYSLEEVLKEFGIDK